MKNDTKNKIKNDKKIKVKKIKKPYAKCVDLAKEIAKFNGGYKCLRCGALDRSVGGDKQIHGSHIFGIGSHPKMATYPNNVKCLCASCHMWWHSSPCESGLWFRENYENWFRAVDNLRLELEENERGVVVIDYQKRYWGLKALVDIIDRETLFIKK